MAKTTYKIQAVKPDGSPVVITGRLFKEINKVRKAMTSNGYTNIRVFKDLSPDMLFVQGIMKETKCDSDAAMIIYKKIAKVMAITGIELIKIGELQHASN